MQTKLTLIRQLLGAACMLTVLTVHAQKKPAAQLPPQLQAAAQSKTVDPAIKKKAEKLLHDFETTLRFEPATSTTGISYTTRGNGFTAGFGTNGVWYNQQGIYDSVGKTQHGYAWQVSFAHANQNLQPQPAEELGYPVHNYRNGIGKDDGKAYKEMWYRNVYAGTDCRFYGNDKGELEYDFVLQPGADAKNIGLAYNGLQNLQLEADSSVSFYTTAGRQQHGKPYAYQLINGKEQQVAVSYTLNENKELGFAIHGSYDKTAPLVIDPVVFVYGTFIGGTRANGNLGVPAASFRTDAAGNIYTVCATGNTPGMVTTPGAFDAASVNNRPATSGDVEISAFSISGTPLFVTYLGGGYEEKMLDSYLNGGSFYVTGNTQSLDFPTTTGAYTLTGTDDYFITRLNATTGAAIFSTVLHNGNVASFGFSTPIYMAFNAAGDYYLYLTQYDLAGTAPNTYNNPFAEIYKFNHTTNTLMAGFAPKAVTFAPVFGVWNMLTPYGIIVNNNDIVFTYGSTNMGGLGTTPSAVVSTNTNNTLSYYENYNGNTGAKLYSSYYGSPGLYPVVGSFGGTILANGQAAIEDYGNSQQTTDGVASLAPYNHVLLSFNASGTAMLWAKSMGTVISGGGISSITPIMPVGNDFISATMVDNSFVNGNNATGTPGAVLVNRPNPSGFTDSYIYRMDAAGNKVWATYFGLAGRSTFLSAYSTSTSGNEIAFIGTGGGPRTADAAFTGNDNSFLAILNVNTGALVYSTALPTNITNSGAAMYFDANRIVILNTTGGIAYPSFMSQNALQASSADGSVIVINRCNGKIVYATNVGGSTAIAEEYNYAQETSTSVRAVGNKIILGYAGTAINDVVTSNGYKNTRDGAGSIMPVVKIFDLAYTHATDNTTSPTTLEACQLGVVGTITGSIVKQQGLPDLMLSGIAQQQNELQYSYQWQSAQSASGPWTDIGGAINKDYTPSPTNTSTWYRRNAVDNTTCTPTVVSTSNITALTINSNVAPTGLAGPGSYICSGTATTLSASATGGVGPYTYEWYVGSANTPNATTAVYNTPSLNQATVFTLKVTDALGCADLDQVTVTTLAANAGLDQGLCGAGSGVQIGMSPHAGSGATYLWTPATGLSSPTIANPVATPAVTTVYTLSVYPPGSPTPCTPSDDVTITPVAAPVITNFAGPDVTVCKGEFPVIGTAAEPGFSYTWAQGAYLTSNTTATTTVNYGSLDMPTCPMTYLLTASKDGCSFSDQTVVSVINAYAGLDGCSYQYFGSNFYSNCVNASFSWAQTGGAGTGTILSGANSPVAYLKTTGGDAVYTRTTTLNGVSCTDDVVVSTCGGTCPIITVTSKQSCAKVFPGIDIQLTYNLPLADYDFFWSSPAGAIFDNPTSNVVTITSTVNTTVTVTAINKLDPTRICTDNIQINSPAASLPVFTAADVSGCPNVPIQIGAAPVAGYSYQWIPASGLTPSAVVSNPMATVIQTTDFIGTATEISSGCTTTDTSTVTIGQVYAYAGSNKTVCQSGIITLGTPALAGNTYSWNPAGAAYQNGTGPTNAQPQVLIAGAPGSSQVFTVTVTNAAGCTATSATTITVATNSDSYLGTPNPVSICQGSGRVLGVPAVPGATYAWTPVTGLSCTDCAQPFATPSVSTNYSVAVSFTGCTLNGSGTRNVIVNEASLPALPDVFNCPNTPIAIGYSPAPTTGFTGTISSWSWSPSTGLSSATIANPTTTVQVPTSYTVTANFSTGCKATSTVLVSPVGVVNAGQDKAVCVDGSTTIGSAANSGTVTWSPATDLSCTVCAQPTVSPTSSSPGSTIYTATYLVGGCTVTDQVTVTVNTPAPPSVSGNQSVCGNACTIITGTSIEGRTYQWAPTTGVEESASPTTKICPGGVSTLYKLYETNTSTGCTGSTDVYITVNPFSVPTVSADHQVICPGNSAPLALNVSPAGSYTYSWTPAASLSNPYIANPVATPNGATTYVVTVTTAAGCENVAQINVDGTKRDFGDLDINTWPVASASIPTCNFSADAPAAYNGNNIATTSVWAGDKISDENATVNGGSASASTDAFDDGLDANLSTQPGTPTQVTVYLNANKPNTRVYYRVWIDWNANGSFADDIDASRGENGLASYTGSAVVSAANTPVPINFDVTVSANANVFTKTRLVVSDIPIANMYRTIGATTVISLHNGEVEDYEALILLPTDLLSFTATKSGNRTILGWETTAISNTSSFIIQRNAGGEQWQDLATIPAGSRLLYTYYDNSPLSTANYYRLVQINKDGTKRYSAIRILNFGNKPVIAVYPNPVSKWLTVTGMNAGDKAELLDISGKRLNLLAAAGNSAEQLNMGNLVAGIYLLKVTTLKGEVTVLKVMKEK